MRSLGLPVKRSNLFFNIVNENFLQVDEFFCERCSIVVVVHFVEEELVIATMNYSENRNLQVRCHQEKDGNHFQIDEKVHCFSKFAQHLHFPAIG